MNYPISNRIELIRKTRFIGREAERKLFIDAIQQDQFPFHVLYIYGPGGIGKTELINDFISICRLSQIIPVYVDSRNLEPSPVAFLSNLAMKLEIEDQDPIAYMAEANERFIVFTDAYDTMVPIDAWFRDNLLQRLSNNVILVLSSQNSPVPAWYTDPGCRMIFRKMPLNYFTHKESIDYLDLNGVPRNQHQNILDFAHGHPMALALIADLFHQKQSLQFQPEDAPDIIHTLLSLFVQQVPGPAHRIALEISSLMRATSEPVLSEIMGLSDVHEIFEWLRGLSFIESGRRGIFPHDMAREALIRDLKWRNPEWYRELHTRIRAGYVHRIREARGEQEKESLLDYVYLHRFHPVVRPFFEWQQTGQFYNDACEEQDLELIRRMIRSHEGKDECKWFDFWYSRQPESVNVFRNADLEPVGMLMKLALQLADASDLEKDPATRAICQYLVRHAPIRSGEKATFFRFWMDSGTYQQVSAIQSLIFISMIQHSLRTTSLAYTLIPCADPDFWQPIMTHAEMHRMETTDFKIDGTNFGVFGHDWRKMPPAIWLEIITDRETDEQVRQAVSVAEEPLLVLDKVEFTIALKNALHDLERPDKLAGNPLLRSRIVADHAEKGSRPGDQAQVLIEEIKKAILTLQSSSRDEKYFRVMEKTYLKSARSQEKASESLGLPFSTYRRHLKNGFLRVNEILWQKELTHN